MVPESFKQIVCFGSARTGLKLSKKLHSALILTVKICTEMEE